MAVGTYGTTIPIFISNNEIPSLVDISYCYHETREYDSLSSSNFIKLSSNLLTPAKREDDVTYMDNFVEGMYNLQLPLSEFNRKGFYTVFIKPREVEAVITDVGNLTAFPNVRGLVFDTTQIKDSILRSKAQTSNELVGYRIIYFTDDGTRQNYYRIITSNNKCEPVVMAPNSSSDKSYSYRYDESSSLSFVTVSPSSAPTFKDNATPYIGKPTQKVALVNTLFEPIQLDIEMVNHDADTISYMLENHQLRDLDNGLVTTFDDNGAIYHQTEHYTLKDQYTGRPVYEIRKNRRNNINFSQTIEDKL